MFYAMDGKESSATATANNQTRTPLAIGILGERIEWMVDQSDPSRSLGHVSITIICPHCREEHSHGFSPGRDDPSLPSHRVGHCRGASEHGYYIRPAMPGEPEYHHHGVDPFKLLVRPSYGRRYVG
jgi:hypothetical protein